MKLCPSGIKYLDKILGGGLPKPSLILIAGSVGVGKTTLALQSLSAAAANGEKALYIPITSQSAEKLMEYLHNYTFFNDNIIIHPVDRSTTEKDPLTTLLDIGNKMTSTNPDRVVLNPLTTLGFGFSVSEIRRFYYSFDAMLQDWSAQTIITGELSRQEAHNSILSHIVDGVIYLGQKSTGNRTIRKMDIIKMRGVGETSNIARCYEFKIETEGIRIFPKLEPEKSNRQLGNRQLSTGVMGLDSMMHGGIPSQSTILVMGGAGTGKTLLGLQFIMAGLKLGEPGIIILFEEREDQLIYEASRMGWDLKGFMDSGLLRMIYVNPRNISPDEHNLDIQSHVENIGAKRLLYDGVYNLESVIPDPVELREHIRLLTDYLKCKGITVMLTNEVSKKFTPDNMPDMSISSIADAIIMLNFTDGQNRFDRTMSVLKLRGSHHDMSVRKYIIGDHGIEIVQKGLNGI
jgi:circadian clock protein KaiC